jgi:hypothetical protein
MRVDLPDPEGPVKRMIWLEARGRSKPSAMMWRPVSKPMPKWSMRIDALVVRAFGRNAWEAWINMLDDGMGRWEEKRLEGSQTHKRHG